MPRHETYDRACHVPIVGPIHATAPAGVYFCRFRHEDYVTSNKVVVLD